MWRECRRRSNTMYHNVVQDHFGGFGERDKCAKLVETKIVMACADVSKLTYLINYFIRRRSCLYWASDWNLAKHLAKILMKSDPSLKSTPSIGTTGRADRFRCNFRYRQPILLTVQWTVFHRHSFGLQFFSSQNTSHSRVSQIKSISQLLIYAMRIFTSFDSSVYRCSIWYNVKSVRVDFQRVQTSQHMSLGQLTAAET